METYDKYDVLGALHGELDQCDGRFHVPSASVAEVYPENIIKSFMHGFNLRMGRFHGQLFLFKDGSINFFNGGVEEVSSGGRVNCSTAELSSCETSTT